MKHPLALSLVAISVSLPYIATAQPPGGGRGPGGGSPLEMIGHVFDMADANRDGQVSKAELTAVLNKLGARNQQGRGGPPPRPDNGQDQGQMQRGPGGGPPPRPGQVLPDSVIESLGLNERQ